MAQYIAVVRRTPDSIDYSVDIPDIPGCESRAHTIEIARISFAEALGRHYQALRARGEELPPPRDRDELTPADLKNCVDTYVLDPDRLP